MKAMFKFLQPKKPTIHSVNVPTFNWDMTKDESAVKQWINPGQTMGLTINYFSLKPDIPTLQDIHVLRAFYRKLVSEAGGGIIEVSLMEIQGFPVIKTIFKFPQVPSGMTYLASLTIPFHDCSYVVKLQAIEVPPAGIRDSVVLKEMINKELVTVDGDLLHGWMKDPYDADFQGGRLMNLSEGEGYDGRFPEHPLSLVRGRIKELEEGIVFGEELKKIRGFQK
jgi:hypothetical protein